MRKFLLLVLILLVVAFLSNLRNLSDFSKKRSDSRPREILRFALVSDSENENELLAKALSQAQGAGVNFVIGLGDFSSLGTGKELAAAKKIFDQSGLSYFVTAGDRDLWDSRNRKEEPTANFNQVFGKSTDIFNKEGIQFVILDNSDIYNGIDSESWRMLEESLSAGPVSGFPPASARSSLKTIVGQKDNVELRAVGSPSTAATRRLTFIFAHKTPFHPQSSHVMGEDNAEVLQQARKLMDLLEQNQVDGFFSGDLHFFARFNSPNGNVKISTIGAVNKSRNFQGPRFAIVTVFDDYTWEVEDIEIR